MHPTIIRVLGAASAAVLLSSCAVAGAGVFNGVPTNTQASNDANKPNATASKDPNQPDVAQNKANAGKAVEKVSVNADSAVVLIKKQTKVTATVSYLDGAKDGNVIWSSNDQTIATINETTGEVSGVKEGVATIYAKAASDTSKFAIINVTVKPGVVEDLSAKIDGGDREMMVDDTDSLVATVKNSSGDTHPGGSWKSSNPSVVYVNDTGDITARAEGTATITFMSDQDSSVKATIKVTVKKG